MTVASRKDGSPQQIRRRWPACMVRRGAGMEHACSERWVHDLTVPAPDNVGRKPENHLFAPGTLSRQGPVHRVARQRLVAVLGDVVRHVYGIPRIGFDVDALNSAKGEGR